MTATALSIEHVTKRYGSGATEVVAVHDVSLSVAPGEVVLIMGPSGSGKTTLLSMLGALLKPTDGAIRLNRQVLSDMAEDRLPAIRLRQFGFIFQDFNLLSALTALENVAIVAQLAGASAGAARAKAAALLTDLGLTERLDFLPEKLSGGEKQRVAIARALVNDPALILADEPTANLDSKIGREIMRRLRAIAKEQGRSVVIVSHDQRIKEIADRLLWLEDGEFKEMRTMATDPVCGMAVEQEQAIAATWDGAVYHFCSRGCRDEFASGRRSAAAPAGTIAPTGSAVDGPGGDPGTGVSPTRRVYDRTARFYDLFTLTEYNGPRGAWYRHLWRRLHDDAERIGADHRPRLLEVGVGTGVNLAYYPPGVEVTAIDLSPRMLERARTKAVRAGVAVDLHEMDAAALRFPDATFDLALATCVFCSVDDPVASLRELRRVMRPGGRLYALEHGLSGHRSIDFFLRQLSPISRRLVGPALDRDPIANIERAGWRIVERRDHLFGIFHTVVAEAPPGQHPNEGRPLEVPEDGPQLRLEYRGRG
ncbi:MAG: hypothetical protein A2X23_04980 [Chloroflexi bacterium GWC2_73_18]|nr:MAG: hypothetical protein A2X23_04980 [Chloroflexi bacterium GWC2_73_18]